MLHPLVHWISSFHGAFLSDDLSKCANLNCIFPSLQLTIEIGNITVHSHNLLFMTSLNENDCNTWFDYTPIETGKLNTNSEFNQLTLSWQGYKNDAFGRGGPFNGPP